MFCFVINFGWFYLSGLTFWVQMFLVFVFVLVSFFCFVCSLTFNLKKWLFIMYTGFSDWNMHFLSSKIYEFVSWVCVCVCLCIVCVIFISYEFHWNPTKIIKCTLHSLYNNRNRSNAGVNKILNDTKLREKKERICLILNFPAFSIHIIILWMKF